MPRKILSDSEWERIEGLLPGREGTPGARAKDNRLFLEAVLWIVRTGAPWRELPEYYGYWHRVYVRYSRWSHKGIWEQVFKILSKDIDPEYTMIDGSVVRVHQHGAAEKTQQDEQAQGKSVGGLSTKIHAAVDGLGNPVRFILTRGQDSEYKQASALIEGFETDYVLADKGYDSNEFIEIIEQNGATAVIPPRKNRIDERDFDKVLYKERNLVERLFQKLKSYRRIATRYERSVTHYYSLLYLVSSVIWLQ